VGLETLIYNIDLKKDLTDCIINLDCVSCVLFKHCGRLSFLRDYCLVKILTENIRSFEDIG